MSNSLFKQHIKQSLEQIKQSRLYKQETPLLSAQSAQIKMSVKGQESSFLNLCANNYLGLANHPEIIKASKSALDDMGYGMASARFLCGTHQIHRKLEKKIAAFSGFDDAILFAACFDANGGVFEPLFTKEDAIISDSLNHASIIDGIRLCKAQRFRYQNRNLQDLEAQLKKADQQARFKLIVTDGVFSMDGTIAPLKEISKLADQYQALIMVDDCHASGFMGENGKGTASFCGVDGKVDILTGTLGKALGGAMGGYICSSQAIINLLRQKARPYLFSNALAPSLVQGAITALEIIEKEGAHLTQKLFENTHRFRQGLTHLGFTLLDGEHPIIPIMFSDEHIAQQMAETLFEKGVYVVSLAYPVVPKGKARIRTQMSAEYTKEQINIALSCFEKAGKKLGVI